VTSVRTAAAVASVAAGISWLIIWWRSVPHLGRFGTIGFTASAVSLAALIVGTALQFWRFRWGS